MTNEKGESKSQQIMSTTNGKNSVNLIKNAIGIANVGYSLFKLPETVKSAPSSAGVLLDIYSVSQSGKQLINSKLPKK